MTKCSFTPQQKAAPACLPPASWVESTRPGPASKLGPRCASESLRWCQPGPRSHVSVLHTYRRQERGESLAEATLPHPVSERTELLQASHTTDLPADVRQPASRAAHTRCHTRTHMHTYTHTHIYSHRDMHTHPDMHSFTHTHTHPDTHTHAHIYPDTHTPRHTHTLIHSHTHSHSHIHTHTLAHIHTTHTQTHSYPHTHTTLTFTHTPQNLLSLADAVYWRL